MSDSENIHHLTECPGCSLCDYLMEMYEACELCGAWGHKSCAVVVPDDNGVDVPVCYQCELLVDKMGFVAARDYVDAAQREAAKAAGVN